MPYGWMGNDLGVDLSRGKIEKKETGRKFREFYLGGKGTNAKILWDRVPPEVDPFSPDSLLVIGAGLLCGTIVPGANRTVVTYKSPLTDILASSCMGGFFAPELKYAGYDTIVISGKSPTPVYLWINDDHVEIRDASHLWGEDTHETQRLIREELKKDRAQIMCIGPAGENKVYCASIEHGNGPSASRAAPGAVMGDKKLKAVAVCGTKDVNIAKPSRLVELSEQILNRVEPVRSRSPHLGSGIAIAYTDRASYGNFNLQPRSPELQQRIDNMRQMTQDFMDRARTREVACYNCGLRCRDECRLPDGGYCFPKCGSWGFPMVATTIVDIEFANTFYSLVEKYGVDTRSIGSIIAFAIDVFQRGILTKEDTDGKHLEWEDPETAFWLLEKIVRREGIGDVLANGVYRAAQQIGKGAEKYAHNVKKMEGIEVPMRAPHYALMEAISDRGDHQRVNSMTLGAVWPLSRKEKEEYIKEGFFLYPKEYEKYFLADYPFTGDDFEGMVQLVSYSDETYTLADSTGICAMWMVFRNLPVISSRSLIADLISCVTGMDINETELTKIIKRVVTLVRAYNVREGIKREDDRIPEIHYHIDPPAPFHRPDRDKLNKWIDRWYEIKGCNREGIPTKETLEELDLDYVRQDLERRGILTG